MRKVRLVFFAVLALMATLVAPIGAFAPAFAADVDYVINVSTNKAAYNNTETVEVVIKIDNRGNEDATAPATVTLTASDVYFMPSSAVTCEGACDNLEGGADGGGGGTWKIPPLARDESTTLRLKMVPMTPGTARFRATVSPGDGDTEIADSTNVSIESPTISETTGDYATSITPLPDADTMHGGPWTVVAGIINNSPDAALDVAGIMFDAPADILSFRCAPTSPNPCPDMGPQQWAGDSGYADTDGDGVYTPTGATERNLLVPVPLDVEKTYLVEFTLAPVTDECRVGAPGTKDLTASSAVVAMIPDDGDPSDNYAETTATIDVPQCASIDLTTQTVTQPDAQANGLSAGDPFEYTVTYSNVGSATARAIIYWDSAVAAHVPYEDRVRPECTTTGGATCPTYWNLNGPSVNAGGVKIPPGGTVTVVYTGIVKDLGRYECRAVVTMPSTAWILPDNQFHEPGHEINVGADEFNKSPTHGPQGQWYGNNAYTLNTSVLHDASGSECEPPAHDLASEIELFADEAMTVPLPSTVTPGQEFWFRVVGSSIDPSVVPDTLSLLAQAAGGAFVNATGAGANWGSEISDVECQASNGAACPSQTVSSDGWQNQYFGASAGVATADGETPVMPSGGQLVLTGKITVSTQPLSVFGFGGQPVTGVNGCWSPTLTSLPAEFYVGSEIRGPVAGTRGERNNSNNSATTALDLIGTPCATDLAVTKTADRPHVTKQGETSWTVVVENTGALPIEKPRIAEHLRILTSGDPEVTSLTSLNCAPSGGAVCPEPAQYPQVGMKTTADGTTTPLPTGSGGTVTMDPWVGYSASSWNRPLFDFEWGADGQNTMPPGSSITFTFTFTQKNPDIFWRNNVVFGAPGHQSVNANASLTPAVGAAIGATKTANPTRPRPGQKVTFTVDITNLHAPASHVYVTDTVSSGLRLANPSGFGDLTCRPLTADDQVLPRNATVNAATCPTFTSDENGLTGTILDMPKDSGLRLTYTAFAPKHGTSETNQVIVSNDDIYVSTGDAVATVNLLVQALRVTGTVWHDADNSADGTFANIRTGTETGTEASGLTAVLVASDGIVLDTVPVGADGRYEFNGPSNETVTVHVTQTGTAPAAGEAFDETVLTGDWAATTPLSRTFDTTFDDVSGIDFGVQHVPDTDDKTAPAQTNPGGDVRVQVPDLSGDDFEDGTIGKGGSFQIVTLPADGTLYYDGQRVTAGQVIDGYDPNLLTVDPNPGAVTVVFTYVAVDSAGNPDPTPATVTMPFTASLPATISGTVFNDANRDGARGPSEAGIAGVTIILSGVDETGAKVRVETVTDKDGNYTFTGLTPGNYTVTETQPAGYTDGPDFSGSVGGVVGNDQVSDITVVSGTDATGYNFAEYEHASLSGHVWEDRDGNGRFTNGEPGIAGVTVVLYDADGNEVATMKTDDQGRYEFTGLAPGTYKIRQVQPDGYVDGDEENGSLGGIVGPDTFTVTVGVGDTGVGYNFGETKPDEAVLPALGVHKRTVNVDGTTVTYRISVANTGAGAATGVVVRDFLPEGYVAGSLRVVDATTGSVSQSGAWTVGGLAPGASETVTFTVDYTAAALARGVKNTARVHSTELGASAPGAPCTVNSDAGSDTDRCDYALVKSETHQGGVDLRIDKATDGHQATDKGAWVTWSVTVTNRGATAARNVTVTDALPTRQVRAIDADRGRFDVKTGVWTIGALKPGQTVTLTYQTWHKATEDVTNVAVVESPDQPYTGDDCQINDTLDGDNDGCDEATFTVPADDSETGNLGNTGMTPGLQWLALLAALLTAAGTLLLTRRRTA